MADPQISDFLGDLGDGQSVADLKNNSYYQNTHELPDAYIGRNHFLMSTLDYLITKDGRDFLTKVILPFEQTDSTNVAWEVFHFDRSIADVEPEQGVPQFVTVKHDVHSNRLVRRGLAFQIEHGFYMTDVGRRHYTMNIQQIVDAVEETTALQALSTLVQTNDYYEANVDTSSGPARIKHLTLQLSRFGVVQRGEHGMHLLDADLKDEMLRQNVRPTAYIMPPRAVSYINMRDPYMTEYNRGGRGAEALAEIDSAPTFRGTRVYEARYFETDYVNEPEDPMVQIITYAEWYPNEAGLHIFNMDSDDWFLVTTPPGTGAQRRAAVGTSGTRNNVPVAQMLPNIEFRRFKGGVSDLASFEAKYLPTLSAEHQGPVMAHLATLDDGSVVRPSYITDFIKTL